MQLHLRVRSNTQDTCEPPAGAGRRKDVRLWRNLLWLLAPYNEVHLTLPYSCKLQLGNKHLWHQLQLVLVEWSVGRNSRLTKKWGFFSKEILRNSSFHWLSRSIFTCSSFGWLSRIGNISSHLHYMMFLSIQTIYFLWGYDPGNMSVSTYLLLLSWAQFTVV